MAKRGRPRHPDILTPREWEVLALLRDGLSNEGIAERLAVTERTARFHVSEILSKLGVATRQEAAKWEPEQYRPWWALAVTPFAGARWPRVIVAAAVASAAALVVAGAGLLTWGLVRTDGEAESSETGAGALIAIGAGHISVIDSDTGRLLGTVDGSDALFRRSHNELLVVDRPKLRVYDLDDLTSPKGEVDMPGLRSPHVWHPTAVLSGDERYLYYPAFDEEATRRPCPNGGDTMMCDVRLVGIISLDRFESLPGAYIGTGQFVTVRKGEGSTALTVWHDMLRDRFVIRRLSVEGDFEDIASLPGGDDQSPLQVGTDGDGRWYTVSNDGALYREGQLATVGDFLPDTREQFSFNTSLALGATTRGLAIQDRTDGSQGITGVVVFDASSPQTAQSLRFESPADHVAATDASQLAILREGVLELLDLTSRKVTRKFAAPVGAEWLIGS